MSLISPFIINLVFRTPIAAGHLPTLDAILSGVLAQWEGDEAALANLPLTSAEGVYHASRLFVDGPEVVVSIPKVAMRNRTRGDVPEGVSATRGKYRDWPNLLNTYDVQAAGMGLFAGVGDIDAVEGLFHPTFPKRPVA